MKNLKPKILAFAALAAISLSTAHSAPIVPIDKPTGNSEVPVDITGAPEDPTPINISNSFSHGVLVIPGGGPENEQAWSKVITNQADWKNFFRANFALMTFLIGYVPTLPDIDFDKYQILSGGLGVKPSTGYSLVVNNVAETNTHIIIDILEISPEAGCLTMPILTYPSATFYIKKTEKPLQFNLRKLTESCL